MSALSAYLAKNYLNASGPSQSSSDLNSERPKKRRKKDKSGNEGSSTLLIADDDDLLLSGSTTRRTGVTNGEDDNDGGPMMYDNDGRFKSAEFRKKKSSTWNTIQDPNALPSSTTKKSRPNTDAAETPQRRRTDRDEAQQDGGVDDEADAILASAARDQDERLREIEMEDAPTVVPTNTSDRNGDKPLMESGVRAGLQTAADTDRLAMEEERLRRAEEKALRKSKREAAPSQEEVEAEQTIYRDATGRRIDVSMKRAEARAKEIEKIAAEKQRREEAMGDVQRRMKEERKVELEEAKFLTLGRGVEDEEMNDRLRDVQRWDDPMAAYMAQKRAADPVKGDQGGGGGGAGVPKREGRGGVVVAVQRKKVYQGSAAPNRYGILPGWRWDGVDRGNGFEKDWFQARSRKGRNEELAYQWQMDE